MSQGVYCDTTQIQLSCPCGLLYPKGLMEKSECRDIKGCVSVDWDGCMMWQDADGEGHTLGFRDTWGAGDISMFFHHRHISTSQMPLFGKGDNYFQQLLHTHTHTQKDIPPSPKCPHPCGIRHRLSLLFQSWFGTFESQLKGSYCHAQGSSAVTKEI